jgi:hypothetical protein
VIQFDRRRRGLSHFPGMLASCRTAPTRQLLLCLSLKSCLTRTTRFAYGAPHAYNSRYDDNAIARPACRAPHAHNARDAASAIARLAYRASHTYKTRYMQALSLAVPATAHRTYKLRS